MTLQVLTFPNRASWLAERRKSLGGSDASVLCGTGFTSEYALFTDKCGLATFDVDDVPEYVEAGSFLEPGVLAWWSHRTGLVAMPTPLTIIRNPRFPWMHASPDALVGDDAGVDAKCVDVGVAHQWEDGVPLGYQVQGQHYMAVLDRARWHFGASVGGRKLLCATVERDEAFIAALVERERVWWERHVVGREAPTPDGSEETTRALKRAFPTVEEGAVVPLGPDAVALHDELRDASEVADAASAIAAECKNKLLAMVGAAQYGVMPEGRGAWRRRPVEGSTFEVTRKPYIDFRFTKEIKR